MKKLLALVLALVMTLSLCVVSSNAAFEGENITNYEAAMVLNKLGILVGDEFGKLNPDDILTREQAAKIICCMLLGVKTAEKLTVEKKPFKDVEVDRWSAPYIAYDAANGIIDGDGNGYFFPAAPLTGHAFGKMLLTALGVKGTFTGSSWAINVATALAEEDLDKGVEDVVLSQNLNRDNASQFGLNGLKYTADGEKTYGVDTDDDGEADLEFDDKSDALLYAGLKDNASYVGELENTEGSLLDEVFDVTATDGLDAFGRPATVYSNDDWDKDLTFADKADYTFVIDEETDLDDLIEDNKLEKKITDTTVADVTDFKVGQVVELFVDTDKKAITNEVVYSYKLVQIDDVEECDEDDDEDAIADGAKYVVSVEETDVYDIQLTGFDAKTYVEDAYIVVAVDKDGKPVNEKVDFEESGKLTVYSFTALADTVEGKVNGKGKGEDYFKVDGTKYVNAYASDYTTVKLNDEGTFYLDPNGFVLGFEEDAGSTNVGDVVYVVCTYAGKTETDKYGTETTKYYAQIVDLDGEVDDLVVGIEDGDDTYGIVDGAYMTMIKGGLFTYKTYTAKKEIDGVNYKGCSKLESWAGDDDYKWDDFDADSDDLEDDAKKYDGYRLNSKTAYILIKDEKADIEVTKKVGGVNVDKEDIDGVAIYSESSSNKVAEYVFLPGAEVGSASYDDVIYVDADADFESVEVADTDCVKFEAYAENGKKVEITIEGDAVARAGFYTYSIDDDGIYELEAIKDIYEVDKTTGVIYVAGFKSYYETLLTIEGGVDEFETENAVFVDLHDDDADGQYSKAVKSLSAMKTAADKGYTVTMNIYGDADDGALLIVVISVAKDE